MRFNAFGNTGMSVSEIGFGGSRIGGIFADKNSSAEALKVLRQALDSGITFYDTSDMYAQGESEFLIGKAFHGRRAEVILATKGGYCLPARRSFMKHVKPLVRPLVKALGLKRSQFSAGISGSLSQDFSPAYLTKALESSLKRMRTEYVDLYQLHSPQASFMQSNAFSEALGTLAKLRGAGKLRFYGVATEVPEEVPFCLAGPGISSVQLGFGLLDLNALDCGMLVAARARDLGVIARGCFAGGLLKDGLDTAQLATITPKWPRILALRALSRQMGRSLLDVAFQFCRGTPQVSVTLLGMHKQSQLRDNLRYLNSPLLTAEEYTALRNLGMAGSGLPGGDAQ